MREQGVFLEHHRCAAFVWRKVVNLLPVDPHLTFIYSIKSGDRAKEGGFAASTRSKKCDEFTAFDLQVNISQHMVVAEHFIYIF
ncbi:hypothetical protein D3C76_707600 [compost metagenome]